jgi:hypothetical protein
VHVAKALPKLVDGFLERRPAGLEIPTLLGGCIDYRVRECLDFPEIFKLARPLPKSPMRYWITGPAAICEAGRWVRSIV